MSFWRIIKSRVIAVAAGIVLIFISLRIVYVNFAGIMRIAIEELYQFDDVLEKLVLGSNTIMVPINDLLQRAGVIPLMFIAFFAASIMPVIFIMKDYYETKSICTFMRLPVSKTFYYLDKLFPPVLLLGAFWFMLLGTVSAMARLYIREVPAEKLPPDVRMTLWRYSSARLLYPFEDPSHIPAALSLIILVPAVVILFVLAERSKKRGIFSGVIACTGVAAILIHLLNLPASTWVVPSITAIVLSVGIWHINRVQIT